jgi:SAM-dependent methyltransferase
MEPNPPAAAGFDTYAQNYDAALNQGLMVSGEDKSFFARGRIGWLAQCLGKLSFRAETVLDFGCGTGSAMPFFRELLGAQSIIGVDVSRESLAKAQEQGSTHGARFFQRDDYQPDESVDLVFCNGVFHHIPPAERAAAIRYVVSALRPGGLFAFWENNPWNPGTRYVMSRIPFDRDAIMLTAREARNLLTDKGMEIVRTDYCFIFPRLLKALRIVEPFLCRLPFGAQYQVLSRKPG